jgi:glycosyltransferase involved in cell wall biosynthesis
MTDTPLVSIVIASVNGMPMIAECLDAIENQKGAVACEVLVVDRCGEPTRAEIRQRFPRGNITVIAAPERTSIPKLRAIGMTRARGRLIAILEDHVNVVPTWLEGIQRLHMAGHQVMGGPVENAAVDRITDWAVFFCEYARFMSPTPHGHVDAIAGSNAVYDRLALERLGAALQDEVWEGFLHQKLAALGIPFHCDPAIAVHHKKEFGFWYFMSQRYHYSRSFAGTRLAEGAAWKRLAYSGATVLLPPLLLWRMATTIWPKRDHRRTFLTAVPLICVFLASYAWGEAVGAVLGPGDSLARVE